MEPEYLKIHAPTADALMGLGDPPASRAQVALSAETLKAKYAALHHVLALDTSWPLADVLAKLIEASDILMHQKNYDGDGWEQIQQATLQAKIIHRNLTVKIGQHGST